MLCNTTPAADYLVQRQPCSELHGAGIFRLACCSEQPGPCVWFTRTGAGHCMCVHAPSACLDSHSCLTTPLQSGRRYSHLQTGSGDTERKVIGSQQSGGLSRRPPGNDACLLDHILLLHWLYAVVTERVTC